MKPKYDIEPIENIPYNYEERDILSYRVAQLTQSQANENYVGNVDDEEEIAVQEQEVKTSEPDTQPIEKKATCCGCKKKKQLKKTVVVALISIVAISLLTYIFKPKV